jgi:hypothetical protein
MIQMVQPQQDQPPPAAPTDEGAERPAPRKHPAHVGHMHVHDVDCGHPAIPHETHVDYVHDEHRHAGHDAHYDEH